ncbi:MAG: MTH938/NDUFAF3 family protein [Methylacidiphilales bacterium]|nr:MTH938/NDUFAF3 family protein [Candidatus Methylacidiphilales bacterium]
MQLLNQPNLSQTIKRYRKGEVELRSGRVLTHPFLLTSEDLVLLPELSEMQLFSITQGTAVIDQLLLLQHSIVVLGCSSEPQESFELKNYLEQRSLSFECMKADAACRTHLVLMSENRKVQLLLFP